MSSLLSEKREMSPKRAAIMRAYHPNERDVLKSICQEAQMLPEDVIAVECLASDWIVSMRQQQQEMGGIEALMRQYDLSCEEGILLMCLAEAMLRIPDTYTLNALIDDKLSSAGWVEHIGQSGSAFVNSLTWGLVFSKKFLVAPKDEATSLNNIWMQLLNRSSKPILRKAVKEMMRWMSLHFIMGNTIEIALKRSSKLRKQGYKFSYDMLGEGARSEKTADEYYHSYEHAIRLVGKTAQGDSLWERPSISIKLSALSPNYTYAKRDHVIPVLVEKVTALCLLAKKLRVSITLDAEESDRLDCMLDILEIILKNPIWDDWSGIGLAVQAYQPRAWFVLDWLEDLATQLGKRIPVRLVKGAYWDSEIKKAQIGGYDAYPVFTRKVATDANYIACLMKMFAAPQCFYTQCATHNAYSVAVVLILAKRYKLTSAQFELQLLHGMGGSLHDMIIADDSLNVRCRVYAPVGLHEDLLPYLVRRLLENGANSSFINQMAKEEVTLDQLVQDPMAILKQSDYSANPNIVLPKYLYGDDRLNSTGLDLSDYLELAQLSEAIQPFMQKNYCDIDKTVKDVKHVVSPRDKSDSVGCWRVLNETDLSQQVNNALQAKHDWASLAVEQRADILRDIADGLEAAEAELIAMSVREAGRTVADAHDGVREAVDFCRYYALNAQQTLETQILVGPTGESNELGYQARGLIVCISPWNFPIAIFTGQVSAALVAGNVVIAKPASQTTLIARRVVDIMHAAGVPKNVLQLCTAPGALVGKVLGHSANVNGFMLTGSTDTAKILAQSIVMRDGALVPLIAETGGQNILMADSSALIEQLIDDVVLSAFGSAGQRCSALRILLVQEDIADEVIDELAGAMAVLNVSDPFQLSTDVGPVIDAGAQKMLQQHVKFLDKNAKLIYKCDVDADVKSDNYFAPRAYEIDRLDLLTEEVFGPILHVMRFKATDMDAVIERINQLGFGLTFGIHSRINSTIDRIVKNINVGNIYVNRSITGAVVGVQPFGGRGLSGTGPKAGGPSYVRALCLEQTVSVNTAAIGGDAALVMIDDQVDKSQP